MSSIGVEMITKDAADQWRQDQLQEIYDLKLRLGQDGFNSDLAMLKRAIMLPEELQRFPSDYRYPNPVVTLMKTPFPKKERKKKKGKKR